MNRHFSQVVLIGVLAASRTVIGTATGTALDDIKLQVSHDFCAGAEANDRNFIVYATNQNSRQTIDANFKYDSSPSQQHFILFDANLNPVTDRFPKFHARSIGPHESVSIGCTQTYRAAPAPPGPLIVPIVIVAQSAAYASGAGEALPEDAGSFAAFLLQGGISDCGAGAKPPGLFYLVNLHPFARLSASIDLLGDHGARAGVLTPSLAPLGATRVACSNGFSRPGPITSANLELSAGMEAHLPAAPQSDEKDPPLAPLPLGAISRTQYVCAGSVPPDWIKTNDGWNPTVCGNPATINYNVWTIQQLSDEPLGTVIHACKGSVPLGWVIVGTGWNPTVCGHPATNQPNVMAIRRLN
jgi:hypothetical protein